MPLVVRRYSRLDSSITIELRNRLPLAAFLVLLTWYVAAPTEVAAMGLVALGGLLLSAWLWARAMALGVKGQRQLHYAALQVGDELEEFLALDNQTRLPILWAEVMDRSSVPGHTASSVRAADSHSTLQWRVRGLCSRRGVFTLGPWELRLGDPFGLFLVRQIYTQPQTVMVYPPLAAVPARLLPHTSTVGEHRLLRQPLRAETINAISTRPHIPGDPLRHLHWPTTARRAAPYTKIFEPEATSTLWLIPDFDRAAHVGQDEDSTEETMVILVASLAAHLLHERLSVGLVAYTQVPIVLPPRRGQASLWQFLSALAPLHADCPWPLARTLERAQSLIAARDRVVVLTPAVGAGWLGALKRILGRGGAADVILLDPASFGGAAHAETGVAMLNSAGLNAQVVRRGELNPISGAYGELRRWEFMTLGTGRVVARQTPRSALERDRLA